MSNLVFLTVQYAMAFAAYLLIYRHYLRAWLRTRRFEDAVLPFLLLHCFRYLGLSMLVTGQIAEVVPREALRIMAYGDLAAAFSALLAALAISARSRLGPLLVAIFTVVGIGDLIVIGPTALNAGIFEADIGTMWFFLVTYAPALVLSHFYIAYRLYGFYFAPDFQR